MATQYFRITAYNKKEDYTVIIDSNGYFPKLWQFSVYVRDKGFEVLEVSNDETFLDGNIEKIKPNTEKFYLVADKHGKPEYINYNKDGINYKAIKVDNCIYVPDKTILA